MRDFYSIYTNDELWLIREDGWERSLQNIRESQLSLGNGYLGTRAVLEEIPYDAMPGTYIAGIYDSMGSQVAELINLPNPLNFQFTIQGEKLDLVAMDCLEHKRILNMKKAVLTRHSLYQDSKKKRYDYQSLRFITMHNKNLGVIQITLTPLDAACSVDINTGIDTSVSNAGVLSEGRKRHFRVRELGQEQNAGYLIIETLEKKHLVIYCAGFYYETNGKKIYAADNIFSLKLKKNQTVIFTKVFWIKHFPYQKNHAVCKKKAFSMFHKAFHSDFYHLLKNHIKGWERLWKKADVLIEGTANLQQNLRFNIYHLLICVHSDKGFSAIGARTLSGEGYRGHIFWDAEIFLLPFYLFNFSQVAKNILLYRYNRIDKARELARKEGFRGAKFPWESADTGEEETPEWARDIDRTIIKIHTHKREHHITSDIAYAVYKYYVITGNEDFMKSYGYELIFETARFWASRTRYDPRKRKFVINGVIGPDEFRKDVNNNAYTNMMAKWNLITAYKMFYKIKKSPRFYKIFTAKLNLKEKEIRQWKKIASQMSINITESKIIEQFDGYFKLKSALPEKADENGIPLMPPKIKTKDLEKTQLIKQADVLMLLYLLDDVFSLKTKIVNYNFYLPRTLHKSSLSPAIHSLIACEVGDLNKAYSFFNVSLRTDISNLFGNTHEGIHAAAIGGTWQAVVFGFAGVKIRKENLCINPRMPRTWRKIVFSLIWRDILVKLELDNAQIKIKAESSKQKETKISIFDKLVSLKTNRVYVFKRRLPGYKEDYYY